MHDKHTVTTYHFIKFYNIIGKTFNLVLATFSNNLLQLNNLITKCINSPSTLTSMIAKTTLNKGLRSNWLLPSLLTLTHDLYFQFLATHTHTRLTALCPGLPGWARTRKVKTISILLKQETVSGSAISWAICKSAPRSIQITMPVPHRSVFYRPDALPAAQPTVSKHWRHNSWQVMVIMHYKHAKIEVKGRAVQTIQWKQID